MYVLISLLISMHHTLVILTLFTIVDVGIRFANAIPLKTLTAEEFVIQLINHHIYIINMAIPRKSLLIMDANSQANCSHPFARIRIFISLEHHQDILTVIAFVNVSMGPFQI